MKSINVRVTEYEWSIIDEVRKAIAQETLSGAFRYIIRIARVLYDPKLSITLAMKDSVQPFLNDKNFRDGFPLSDALKNIPELEEQLNIKA